MHHAHRFVGALVLTAALSASGAVLAATPQQASVQGYLTERHEDYRPYDKQSHKRQHEYWNWRHSHPDHD
jgi:hypothetical protein